MPFMRKTKARAKTLVTEPTRNGLREALLGLLAIRPMSGYDLSRSYQRALQQIWYAPLGQIYPTVRKMQQEGLLNVAIEVQRDRPNRKVYRLTPEGKRLLVSWLSQPATLPNMHHEFIHKLFLLNHVDVKRRAVLVDGYVARCKTWASELRIIEKRLNASLSGPHAESAWHQLLSLQHLRRIVECEALSAQQIASDIRARPNPRRGRGQTITRRSLKPLEKAAFAGLSLSPAVGAKPDANA